MEPLSVSTRFISADGEIDAAELNDGSVVLKGKDWQERDFRVLFEDVLAFCAYGIPMSTGGAYIENEDPLLHEATRLFEESANEYTCFVIADVDDSPRVKIVAKGWRWLP